MVGCGNSQLSEQMCQDGYPLITNVDISPSVIGKMNAHYSSEFPSFEYATVDATNMPYRDNSFDISLDKGTFDALACGTDRTILDLLCKEMIRVCSYATIIVSSGTPERRLHLFDEYLDGLVEKTESFRIEISKLAQLINILRTELKDKPLSDAVKGGDGIETFKKAMMKMVRYEKEKKLEEQIQKFGKTTDPRSKLMLLMLKAKRKRDQEVQEKEMQDELEAAAAKIEAEGGTKATISNEQANKLYNPQR